MRCHTAVYSNNHGSMYTGPARNIFIGSPLNSPIFSFSCMSLLFCKITLFGLPVVDFAGFDFFEVQKPQIFPGGAGEGEFKNCPLLIWYPGQPSYNYNHLRFKSNFFFSRSYYLFFQVRMAPAALNVVAPSADSCPLSESELARVVALRRDIHAHPDLSDDELVTMEKIKAFLAPTNPDLVVDRLGGTGLAVVYNGRDTNGPTILLRADYDALPILETNTFEHVSCKPGVSHMCGHDGHTATLVGAALSISAHRPAKGRVVCLFQQAEETGKGAAEILADPRFEQLIKPDMVFGLHNLPRSPKDTVVIKNGTFAASCRGVIIKFLGLTSHASAPEDGRSPAMSCANLTKFFTDLPSAAKYNDFVLSTVIHVKVGEVVFGTSPAAGEFMATIRSFNEDDMDTMVRMLTERAAKEAAAYGLEHSIEYEDVFPATVNNPDAADLVRNAAKMSNVTIYEAPVPHRWCEDFGHFTRAYKGAYFGLGAGDYPQLHNSDYDYPEFLIPMGITVWRNLVISILGA
eukprot:comp22730_c1_seq1/m.35382 comp22730_c1_seq1/g.35382  ORF comp22730_c1_seq1/g.35382 comp22730_c1_seq1/m.35382 type:complete len:517 (-) comp22730_c1_seq1:17-1567(-)